MGKTILLNRATGPVSVHIAILLPHSPVQWLARHATLYAAACLLQKQTYFVVVFARKIELG